MRRGQAAIEYLIILAVVVIIALIVVGVIGGFPTMTRGVSASSSANYWASADIGITRYFVSAGTPKSSMIVIRNNRMFTVNVTNITMGGSIVNVTTGQSLAPGASASVFLSTTSPGCTSGGTYSWATVINYTDATYGSTYTFTGDTPLVGTCQP